MAKIRLGEEPKLPQQEREDTLDALENKLGTEALTVSQNPIFTQLLRERAAADLHRQRDAIHDLRILLWRTEGRLAALEHNHRLVLEANVELPKENFQLRKEIKTALQELAPISPNETLIGAIRNLQQAHLSEKGNVEHLEQIVRNLIETLRALTIVAGNGQICFRTANGVPMGMSKRQEKLVRLALQKAGV